MGPGTGAGKKILIGLGIAALVAGAGALLLRSGKPTFTLAHLPGCPACGKLKPKIKRAKKALERAGFKVELADVTASNLKHLPEFDSVPALAAFRGRKGKLLYGDSLDEFGKITAKKLVKFATEATGVKGRK